MQVCHKQCPAVCGYQIQNLKIQLGLQFSIIKLLISFSYLKKKKPQKHRGSTYGPLIIVISV